MKPFNSIAHELQSCKDALRFNKVSDYLNRQEHDVPIQIVSGHLLLPVGIGLDSPLKILYTVSDDYEGDCKQFCREELGYTRAYRPWIRWRTVYERASLPHTCYFGRESTIHVADMYKVLAIFSNPDRRSELEASVVEWIAESVKRRLALIEALKESSDRLTT